MKKRFIVTIIETLRLDVEVFAENEYEAEQIVADGYNDSQYVLSADNFCEVGYSVIPME